MVDSKQPAYDHEKMPPVFSPDTPHVAYEAHQGAKRRVVLDGSQGRPTMASDRRSFSQDSKHVAMRHSKEASGRCRSCQPGQSYDRSRFARFQSG